MRSFSSTEIAEERFFSEGAVLFRYGLLDEGSVLSVAMFESCFFAQSALKHLVIPHIVFDKLHRSHFFTIPFRSQQFIPARCNRRKSVDRHRRIQIFEKECNFAGVFLEAQGSKISFAEDLLEWCSPVSYTHLTLPTSDLV